MNCETTQYGFRYGPVEVQRIHSDEKKGWVIIDVVSAKRALQVYVTKTGKMRVYAEGREVALNKSQ